MIPQAPEQREQYLERERLRIWVKRALTRGRCTMYGATVVDARLLVRCRIPGARLTLLHKARDPDHPGLRCVFRVEAP